MDSSRVVHSVVQKPIEHTYQKRGFYYYQRRIPQDLWSEYRKKKIIIALKTSCPRVAQRVVQSITSKLDSLWSEMRVKQIDVPAAELLLGYVEKEASVPNLSEAANLYLEVKGKGKGKTFFQGCERAKLSLIKLAGDIPIDRYTRGNANGLRDMLLMNGLAPQSVKRQMSVIKTIINLSINEHALTFPNVFAKIEYGDMTPVIDRKPIPVDDLRVVQQKCVDIDDDIRWLIALISDTGMRLSEAAGLHIKDIQLDHDIPYINLRPNVSRALKTTSSARKIPLVGASLWAAQRLIKNSHDTFAFPRYTSETECKANSASGMLNKWLTKYVPKGCVVHSFRHSIRDRLRAVQCPSDIIDQIGGWKTSGGVGQSYGEGYPISVLSEWMERI